MIIYIYIYILHSQAGLKEFPCVNKVTKPDMKTTKLQRLIFSIGKRTFRRLEVCLRTMELVPENLT
ncbi:unnamed protein product [Larinioides sclopetarius]|uniref:Uncharacterized protein n=1 Tax=Larinioides sclopetarius TaxID=280406 RepID=A0AAV1YQ42_9ARAC